MDTASVATPAPGIPRQRRADDDDPGGTAVAVGDAPDAASAGAPDGPATLPEAPAVAGAAAVADAPATTADSAPFGSNGDEPGDAPAAEPVAGGDGDEPEADGEGGDSDSDSDSDDGNEADGDGDGDSDEVEPEPGRRVAGSGAADPVVAASAVRGRRSPGWAKVLVALGTVLAVLSAGTVVGLHLLAGRYDRSVRKAELIDPGARVSPTGNGGGLAAPLLPQGVTGPLNFLLLGSDARDTDPSNGQRSDTIILVHVPATMDRAYLISIPRDLRVQIPADPTTGFRGGRQKINAAFNFGGGGVGGFQLLSKTLNRLIDVKFDGAAIINFDGFQSAVHLLGGVNMCVDQVTKSIHTGTVYQIGCQHLGAVQALDYVRQRELLPEGDYDRQRHQQQFLKAIFQEAVDQGVATNPIKLDQLIRAVGSALTVDTNGVSLADLVFSLRGIDAASLVGIKLPSAPQMIGGVSYVVPADDAASLYQAIASDTLEDWVAANPSWVNAI